MVALAQIKQALADYTPDIIPSDQPIKRASVALIVDDNPQATHLLLIRRAHNPKDPWSGHLAFPGGRHEPTDEDLKHTAIRETHEEVGVDLAMDSGDVMDLGRLNDVQGRARGASIDLVISCFVFAVSHRPVVTVDRTEVDSHFWVSVDDLLQPDRQVAYDSPRHATEPYPGIRITDQQQPVLWGLTYRFTREFLAIAGAQLPNEVA